MYDIVWYHTWWQGVYPPPKTRLVLVGKLVVLRQSRDLQVQVQDVQIGDCGLVLSSMKPGLSSASNASRLAIIGPSQASLVVVGPPTRPYPSSLSSDTVGAGGRAGTRGNLLGWFCMQGCPSWSGTCSCEKSRVRWAVCMQADQFKSI